MDTAVIRMEVATTQSETAQIEFKSRFDPKSAGDWCELLKDVAAIHNSGGGVIVFGLECDGSRSEQEAKVNSAVDVAEINDKFYKYTNTRSLSVQLATFERDGTYFDGWLISPAEIPVPFNEPGTYSTPQKPDRQKTAFSRGQIYVRHSARSEPATFEDMKSIAQRLQKVAREEMYDRMRVLVDIPEGHKVGVIPEGAIVSQPPSGNEFRFTDDPSAPQVAVIDKFTLFPNLQKEIIQKLVTTAKLELNQYDILCIRRVYASEIKDFVYRPLRGSAHYSDGFADWIAQKVGEDSEFLTKARALYRKLRAA